MKYGIISDIHGELTNLQKALSFLLSRRCEIICLGDLVSEDSEENDPCIQLIKKHNIFTVLGQHDDTCVKMNAPAVSDDSRAFLQKLPIFATFDDLYIVHDNPLERGRNGLGMWSRGSYIKSNLEAVAVFEDLEQDPVQFNLFALGHTHVPKLFSSRQGDIAFSFDQPIKLAQNDKYIINPGRIGGVDREGMGCSCAILDTDENNVVFVQF